MSQRSKLLRLYCVDSPFHCCLSSRIERGLALCSLCFIYGYLRLPAIKADNLETIRVPSGFDYFIHCLLYSVFLQAESILHVGCHLIVPFTAVTLFCDMSLLSRRIQILTLFVPLGYLAWLITTPYVVGIYEGYYCGIAAILATIVGCMSFIHRCSLPRIASFAQSD